MRLEEIVEPLLGWYAENARDLPWRREVTPYRVWISEIMLQQTRVEAVKGYFARFIGALPGPAELAAVDERELLTRPGKDIKGIVFNLENNYGYRERHDLDFSSKGIEEYLQKLEEAGGGGSL